MNFGERLTELRKSKGYTREAFAEYLGISKYTLRNYELSVNEPGSFFLRQISDIFDVSIDYLMGLTDEKERILPYNLKSSEYEHIKKYRTLDPHGKDMVDTVLDKESERIKKYGKLDEQRIISLMEIDSRREPTVTLLYWEYGVSAGNGIYQLNDTLSETMHLWATELTKQADFIIKVHGSSMEPDYHDGDRVLVDRKVNVNIGEVGIFIKNGETYIKELGTNELISRNPECENIFVKDFDNVVCMGKVIGIVTESMIAKE